MRNPGRLLQCRPIVPPSGITKYTLVKVDKNSRLELSKDEQLAKRPRTSTPRTQGKFWQVPAETDETDFSDASVASSQPILDDEQLAFKFHEMLTDLTRKMYNLSSLVATTGNKNATAWVMDSVKNVRLRNAYKKKFFRGKLVKKLKIFGRNVIIPEIVGVTKDIDDVYGNIFYFCRKFRSADQFKRIIGPMLRGIGNISSFQQG